jgi:chromosome partitioning protein
MENGTRRIAIVNEKGGVGKTTSSINIGAALTLLGKKVLLIDMDSQMNATTGLGIQREDVDGDEVYSSYDIIKNYKTFNPDKAIMKTKWENLFLIPGHEDLAGLELELVSQIGRENRLKKALVNMSVEFDFVLVDSPPSLSLLTVNVFSYADEILIPCQTHPFSFEALGNLFETIAVIKEDVNPGIKITGIIPTFFDSRTRVSRIIKDQLTDNNEYKNLIFDTPIRTNTTIAESNYSGEPVIFFDSKSRGAKDYMELAQELVNT